MPFITEEIWHAMYDGEAAAEVDRAGARILKLTNRRLIWRRKTQMAILQDLIVSVRNLRAELKVEPKVKVPMQVFAHDAETRTLIEQNQDAIKRLANVESIAEV